jgi:Kef-type K+ transport system membrane component KefB
LLIIVAAAFVAPLIADALPRISIPVVVVELALGIIIGPQVLGLATIEPEIVLLSQFGLAFLFFVAGFELDIERIRGRPLNLACVGWIGSLIVAGALAFGAHLVDGDTGTIYVALALATTALGTLLPMLRDSGEMQTEFGTHVLAVVAALVLASRWRPARLMHLLEHTMRASSQVAVRLSIFLLVGLVFLASLFGLDFLLGVFAAGLVVGQTVTRLEPGHPLLEALQLKYEGIGFGLLIPIFFVVSGMQFDLAALLASGFGVLLVPVVAACFLLVRGVPTALISGHSFAAADRAPLALLAATQLPLVIAITERGVVAGQLPDTVATLMVGAAMVSVFLFPPLALGFRRTRRSQ